MVRKTRCGYIPKELIDYLFSFGFRCVWLDVFGLDLPPFDAPKSVTCARMVECCPWVILMLMLKGVCLHKQGVPRKIHKKFSDVLPESVNFLFEDGSENQQKSSWTPALRWTVERHTFGMAWVGSLQNGDVVSWCYHFQFKVEDELTILMMARFGRHWNRLGASVGGCQYVAVIVPRQDLWWLWRDGAQHLCWGCPMKGVKIWRMKLRGAYMLISRWNLTWYIYIYTYVFWNNIQKIYTCMTYVYDMYICDMFD